MDGSIVLGDPGSGRRVWSRTSILLPAALIPIGLAVAFLDRPIATYAHDVLHRPAWAVLVTKLAHAPYWFWPAVGILLAAGIVHLTGRRLGRNWRNAIAAALATLLGMTLVLALKFAFGRLWPETWVHDNPSWINNHQFGFLPFHGGQGYASFPSGHTTRVTAPFAVLWSRLPRLRLVWVLPSLAITAALVATDFHFFGDCLAGIWLGVVSAALVLRFV